VGCQFAAQIAETNVAVLGNTARLEIFSQEDRKRRKGEQRRAFGVRAAARESVTRLRAEGAASQEILAFRSSDLPVKKSGSTNSRGNDALGER
jgi:hypothetical protein